MAFQNLKFSYNFSLNSINDKLSEIIIENKIIIILFNVIQKIIH